MNWQWQRRIRHITRRITPIKLRGMRLRLLIDKIRERRGLPPKSIPMTVADARIDLMLGLPSLSVSDIDWLLLRHKLLARKRASRIAARQQRVRSMSDTGIWIAQRRKRWLAQVCRQRSLTLLA